MNKKTSRKVGRPKKSIIEKALSQPVLKELIQATEPAIKELIDNVVQEPKKFNALSMIDKAKFDLEFHKRLPGNTVSFRTSSFVILEPTIISINKLKELFKYLDDNNIIY